MSAAPRTSFQSSSQKAKWWSPPLGPVTRAMSCGVWDTSSQVASWWPSSARICSVSRNPSTSRKNRVPSSTSSAVTKMWSRRGGAIPTSPIGRGRRVGPGEQVADLLHAVDQLAAVPGRGLEADRLAVPGGQLAPGVAGHLAALLLDLVLEPGEVIGVLDLEAHVLQAVGGRVAQDHRVVLVLVPALEEDPLGVPARLQQPQHLGVVGGGQLKVGHPDLDMGQAQDAHLRCGPS